LEPIQIVLVAVLLVQVENVVLERVKKHKPIMTIVAFAIKNVTQQQVKNVLLVYVLVVLLLVLDLMYVVI